MDAGSKKHIIDWFMKGQPKADPNERWTRFDAKAVINSFIAKSNGHEDYSSATDTVCRERIWGKLEKHANDSRKYAEGEDFRYQMFEMLSCEWEEEHKKENPRFDDEGEEDPYFYDDDDDDEKEIDEEKDRQLNEFHARWGAANDRIDEELPSVFPEVIREYLEETPTATYTTLANVVHIPEIIKRVKLKMTWAFASD